jgi:rRNA maturation RNase YbeY
VVIDFHTEDLKFHFKGKRKYRKWIDKIVQTEGKTTGTIVFIFCSNRYIRSINSKYLNHNYFTDVITFDYVEGNTVSGDIFVSVEQVRLNSEEYKTGCVQELERVMIHGILHLIGYGDKTNKEQKIMRRKEDAALEMLRDIE